MSGIPQPEGFYFLLHKDPHCTQQAQILGRERKEKWRGSLKPCLVSKGGVKLNRGGVSPTGVSEPQAAAVRRCENLNTAKSGKRLFDFL